MVLNPNPALVCCLYVRFRQGCQFYRFVQRLARPQPFPSKLGLHRHDAIVILTPRVEKMKFFDRRFRPFGLTILNFLYFIWKEEGKENTIDPSFLKFGKKMTEKKIFEKSLKSQNCCIRIVSFFFLR